MVLRSRQSAFGWPRTKLICLALLAGSTLQLEAQTTSEKLLSSNSSSVWNGAGEVIELPAFPFKGLIKRHRKKGAPVETTVPPGTHGLSFSEGTFYGLREGKSEDDPFVLSECPIGTQWKPFGTSTEYAHAILPLRKDGHYLLCEFLGGYAKDGVASFMGKFRINSKNELLLSSIIEMNLEGPVLRVERTPAGEDHAWMRSEYHALKPFWVTPLQTEDYYLVASVRAGIIWVVSREDGRLRRVVNLYGLEQKQLGIKSKIEKVLLGAVPRSDGKVIIAAMEKEAVLHAGEVFSYHPNPRPSLKAEPKPEHFADEALRFREAERALTSFPYVVWWELDPETGKLEQVFPEKLPTRLKSMQEFKDFRLGILPGDKITCTIPGDDAHR